MKILFCTQTHLSKRLGGSKVVMELAEELERLGWESDIISPADFVPTAGQDIYSAYPGNLRQHLREHAHEYDVVDYDHVYLPYSRAEFPKDTLFVARSVLLVHQLETIRIPKTPGFRSAARTLVKGGRAARRFEAEISQAENTIAEADLVNVSNTHDKAELLKRGIPESKVVVIPFGIDRYRRTLFDAISSEPPEQPTVCFVGTFDNRKGATDLPRIVGDLAQAVANVSFKFLGTGSSEAAVLSHFGKSLRGRIQVVPNYAPEDLPGRLAGCSVGVFPSYVEGFGFGVLEMLAASIPVVAYDSPGPPMMLPPEYLVAPGDTEAMCQAVASLLRDKQRLVAARHWAKARAQEFCWARIAQQTSNMYLERWQARQIKMSA
jgi:glycosyltransferase involved in cell wall biosynthesis